MVVFTETGGSHLGSRNVEAREGETRKQGKATGSVRGVCKKLFK